MSGAIIKLHYWLMASMLWPSVEILLTVSVDLFFWFGGILGQPQGPNFPSPWATMLALRLGCSTAALTTPPKVLPIWKLVELKMLDFSDRTRTGISILTSAAHYGTYKKLCSRRTLSQFSSFKIRRTTLLNYLKLALPPDHEARKLGKGRSGL